MSHMTRTQRNAHTYSCHQGRIKARWNAHSVIAGTAAHTRRHTQHTRGCNHSREQTHSNMTKCARTHTHEQTQSNMTKCACTHAHTRADSLEHDTIAHARTRASILTQKDPRTQPREQIDPTPHTGRTARRDVSRRDCAQYKRASVTHPTLLAAVKMICRRACSNHAAITHTNKREQLHEHTQTNIREHEDHTHTHT